MVEFDGQGECIIVFGGGREANRRWRAVQRRTKNGRPCVPRDKARGPKVLKSIARMILRKRMERTWVA